MELALYQPDIPQNLGSMLRLCACMGVACHIIEPCGFILDDKRIARVAMDYIDQVKWQRHKSWEAFLADARARQARIVLLSTKAAADYCAFEYRATDILLFGRESAGVPPEVVEAAAVALRISMHGQARSLNVVQAASMALGEAMRQKRKMS